MYIHKHATGILRAARIFLTIAPTPTPNYIGVFADAIALAHLLAYMALILQRSWYLLSQLNFTNSILPT